MMKGIQSDIPNYSRVLTDPVSKTNVLIIDSGCSDHIFTTNIQLTNYHVLNNIKKSVQVANCQTVSVNGIGTCGILQRVYYVLDLSHSIISVISLTKAGCSVLLEANSVVICFCFLKFNFNNLHKNQFMKLTNSYNFKN